MVGKKGRGPARLVEPASLLGLSLGDVLLGLLETGEGQPGPAPAGPAAAEEGPALRLRMPDGRVEREPLLGGFWRLGKEGGPPAYLSTLPLYAMQERLLAAGIPCRLSGTAGTFLCNALMYHALRICGERTPAPPCGFVHLPYLPRQVAWLIRDTAEEARLELHQRADLASMSLETMLEGARLAIEVALEHAPPR